MAQDCSVTNTSGTIKASAPGNLMLMGEHAVLKGHRALACAVDKRIFVTLTPRADRKVTVDSALANYHSTLDELADCAELGFMVAVMRNFASQLPAGFDLTVTSEFSHTVGLGSSAAVTAATVAALLAYAGESTPLSKSAVFDQALAVVHKVQGGRGSGTDLAATIYGGVVGYTQTPRQVTSYPKVPAVRLHYVGYKMKTPDVIAKVEAASAPYPEFYSALYELMHQASLAAEQAVEQADWPVLGHWMNVYQGLLDTLGVNDGNLSEMIYNLRQQASTLGSKISGSGLGDCVLSVIDDQNTVEPLAHYDEISVAISPQGVMCEFI